MAPNQNDPLVPITIGAVSGAVLGLENLYFQVFRRQPAVKQPVPANQVHLSPGLPHGAAAAHGGAPVAR